MQINIPRLVIAGASSGVGKTTLLTGLLAAFSAQGVSVQSFKVGPDYIDPGFHQLASGKPSHNLDTWMVRPADLGQVFCDAAQGAQLALVEGVMGLYDGGRTGISSTAAIAKWLQAPVVLVVNCRSMGESAAAVVLGFREYDRTVNLAGVILNQVGSDTHEAILREAMDKINMPVFGCVRRSADITLPERHLGLTPTAEVAAAASRIAAMRALVEKSLDLPGLSALAKQAPLLSLPQDCGAPRTGEAVTVAIAEDEAFSFYYPSSLAFLERAGAKLIRFSPLRDSQLPPCDAVLLGGGFPEMFARELADNVSMRRALKQAADAGLPIYAECGGFMYLTEELQDFDGQSYAMAGVIAGRSLMQKKLQTVGYVQATLRQNSVLGTAGTVLRGHEFHFSVFEPHEADFPWGLTFEKNRDGSIYPGGFCRGNVLASYLHINFLGNRPAAATFLQAAAAWRRKRGRDGQ